MGLDGLGDLQLALRVLHDDEVARRLHLHAEEPDDARMVQPAEHVNLALEAVQRLVVACNHKRNVRNMPINHKQTADCSGTDAGAARDPSS